MGVNTYGKGETKTIELEKGDAIFFRADLPHQGMGYLNENLRIFATEIFVFAKW